DAVLAVLPYGTGSDLAKTLCIPRGIAALDVVCNGESMLADVGLMEFVDEAGAPQIAYFLNTCHIGVGSEVAVQVNRSSKAFGGFTSFLMGTLRALRIYQDKEMLIRIGDV